MKKTFIRIAAFSFVALVLLASCGKKDYTAQIPKGFDEYCQKTLDEWMIPGMAVVVVKDGKTVFMKGYGKTSLSEDAKPVDEKTQFVIASTSKAFTGALLANVMDDYSGIRWDDKVKDHLQDFRLYDQWATDNMMIKEVMTHHTGWKTYALDDLPFFGFDRDGLYNLFGVIKPSYGFRSKYAYNNEMYTVAAKIVEKYTGKSWDDNMAERIFKPLKMNNTTTVLHGFWDNPQLASPCRVLHEGDSLYAVERDDREDAYRWIQAVAPAAAVVTCVEDMQNWLKMHLDHGVFEGDTIISRKNHDYLFYPQTITSYDDERLCAYGQGWTIEQNPHGRYIRHTGLAYGYTAIVGLVPDLNLGVAILTNNGSTSDPQAAIVRQLMAMYYGEAKGKDFSAEYLADYLAPEKEKAAAEEKEPQPALPYGAYLGRYELKGFGTAEIYSMGDSLGIRLNDVVDSPMEHIDGNVFRFRVPGAGRFDLTFKTGIDNRAKALNIDINDPIDDFVRVK